MIEFQHVGMRYGIGPEVLSDISFRLEPGSFHFLSGPSGAGKTTLMSLLYLGMKPTRGLISMFGHDIGGLGRDELAKIRRRIGVVFQDFRLLEHMSVYDNVALPLRICGVGEKEIKKNVSELLHWVGLGERLDALPNTLSGGQQQRVAIARAVIARPKLLLADEPTGNLDDEIGMRLMSLFEQLNRMGTTIVVASHNQAMMEKFAHSKMDLIGGEIYVREEREILAKKLEGVY